MNFAFSCPFKMAAQPKNTPKTVFAGDNVRLLTYSPKCALVIPIGPKKELTRANLELEGFSAFELYTKGVRINTYLVPYSLWRRIEYLSEPDLVGPEVWSILGQKKPELLENDQDIAVLLD